jgi:hypothetical protein
MTDYMKPDKPKSDYILKRKDNDGKYKIVGNGWKRQGPHGEFISVSIGFGQERQSIIVVENKFDEKKVDKTNRSNETKQVFETMPKEYWDKLKQAAGDGPNDPPENGRTEDPLDDSIPF